MLAILAGLVLYTASKHEPWADEAQAWLLARDFSWFRLLVSELRYEGHPAIWFTILSPAIHVFHLPYSCFGYLAGLLAIVGLGVLIFMAPFPRALRYLICFSFFFVYQYAVVARPYVLAPLVGFLAAYFYRKGLPRVMTFAVILCLMMHLSSYTALIAFALAVAYAVQLLLRWKEISKADRSRIFRATALLFFSAVLLVLILYPRPDSTLVADAVKMTFHHHLQLAREGLVGALSDSAFATIPLLILAAVWAYRRGAFLLLILAVGATSLEYGFLRGYQHHQGLITTAFVVSVWVGWPSREQFDGLTRPGKWMHRALLAALLLTFAWHCRWSYSAIRNDWAKPYSGAKDAARFLASIHADKVPRCSGYLFWTVGVQPYFDHNIFINYGGPDAPASYHFSSGFEDHAGSQIEAGPPCIVLAPDSSIQAAIPTIRLLRSYNYLLIYSSDGGLFFKSHPDSHSLYLIFGRADLVAAMQADTPAGPSLVSSLNLERGRIESAAPPGRGFQY